MRFGNMPESKNFVDDTGPRTLGQRLLTDIMINVNRYITNPKGQAQLDKVQDFRNKNPLPPMDFNKNAATTVSTPDAKGGRTIRAPGAIVDEYVPNRAADPGIEAAMRELMRRTPSISKR